MINVGDKVEILVVKIIFGDVVKDVMVSLFKLMMGYLLGVVGLVELIIIILLFVD